MSRSKGAGAEVTRARHFARLVLELRRLQQLNDGELQPAEPRPAPLPAPVPQPAPAEDPPRAPLACGAVNGRRDRPARRTNMVMVASEPWQAPDVPVSWTNLLSTVRGAWQHCAQWASFISLWTLWWVLRWLPYALVAVCILYAWVALAQLLTSPWLLIDSTVTAALCIPKLLDRLQRAVAAPVASPWWLDALKSTLHDWDERTEQPTPQPPAPPVAGTGSSSVAPPPPSPSQFLVAESGNFGWHNLCLCSLVAFGLGRHRRP